VRYRQGPPRLPGWGWGCWKRSAAGGEAGLSFSIAAQGFVGAGRKLGFICGCEVGTWKSHGRGGDVENGSSGQDGLHWLPWLLLSAYIGAERSQGSPSASLVSTASSLAK